MTMNDGMKLTGIHKNNLVSIFILIFFSKGKFYFPIAFQIATSLII